MDPGQRHSKLTASFIKQLESVLEQVMGPIDRTLWESKHDTGSGRSSVFADINATMVFCLRDCQLNDRLGSFVGDIWDYFQQVKTCYMNVVEHKEDVTEFINKNKLLHTSPPTYIAWLLHQYDQKHGTTHARAWVKFLAGFAQDLVNDPTINESKLDVIKAAFKQTFGEIVGETEQPKEEGPTIVVLQNYLSPRGESVGKRLQHELINLDRAVETLFKAAPKIAECTAAEWLRNCIVTALPYMANVDGVVSYEELCLMRDVGVSVGLFEQNDTIIEFRDKLQRWVEKQDAGQIMTMLALLQEYDDVFGTKQFSDAKSMMTWLANEIFLSDGESLAPQEQAWLQNFESHVPTLNIPASGLRANLAKLKKAGPDGAKLGDKSVEDLLAELNELTGLDTVKQDVMQLVNFMRVQQLRESQGLTAAPISKHLVFLGNPGTGKTTVARIVSRVYQSLGILEQGHMIESDRSSFVAEYVGQTAPKVHEIVNRALGGVLFIDEAYALCTDERDSFGKEAVDTLLKLMEDHRKDLIVIVAGYTKNMKGFIESNPGLKSRFNKYLTFEDYTPAQLLHIVDHFSMQSGFRLTPGARNKLTELFNNLYANRDETFGNGRTARNVFEKAITRQADRIVSIPGRVDKAILTEITEADIPQVAELAVL